MAADHAVQVTPEPHLPCPAPAVALPGESAWAGEPARLAAGLRRLYVACLYMITHRRWPRLDQPRKFTEWVQWRKLYDSRVELARLTDKLFAKELVAGRCGAGTCIPTLWSGVELPTDPPAPLPLMVKANHGSGQFRLVRSARDWQRARRAARRWLRRPYGQWLGERQYRSARRLILVEPFVGGAGGRLPEDYKVYVFGGRAVAVQHHVDRGTRRHRWTQFDRSWRRIGGAPSDASPPATLEAMFETAERVARGADFLRVDLYQVEGRVMFGEFCLFPGSGLDPFDPVELDLWLGGLWSAARRAPRTGRRPSA
jgi:hypothetical protein